MTGGLHIERGVKYRTRLIGTLFYPIRFVSLYKQMLAEGQARGGDFSMIIGVYYERMA
jgi:hypothetical protein